MHKSQESVWDNAEGECVQSICSFGKRRWPPELFYNIASTQKGTAHPHPPSILETALCDSHTLPPFFAPITSTPPSPQIPGQISLFHFFSISLPFACRKHISISSTSLPFTNLILGIVFKSLFGPHQDLKPCHISVHYIKKLLCTWFVDSVFGIPFLDCGFSKDFSLTSAQGVFPHRCRLRLSR